MEVKIAKHAGFCFGVKRAVDLVRKEAKKGKVYTIGPLIHNPPMVEKLIEEGVIPLGEDEDISGKRVVIPSHGLPPDILQKILKKADEVIDATCPFVKRAKMEAQKLESQGYPVVIIGEKDHPEVKGIAGSLKSEPLIIASPEEIPFLLPTKIGVISQTTMNMKKVEEILSLLKSKCKEVKFVNTICLATENRQKALLELLPEVDGVVVVGGYNSANTRRLYLISKQYGKPTIWVERREELDKRWFKGMEKVGVTAGASTPQDIIEEVVEFINAL